MKIVVFNNLKKVGGEKKVLRLKQVCYIFINMDLIANQIEPKNNLILPTCYIFVFVFIHTEE